MVKVHLIQFNSSLAANGATLDPDSNAFLEEVSGGNIAFANEGVPVFFVRTGGAEGWFKEHYKEYEPPYFILAQGERNSLAASLEIISFLHQHSLPCHLFYGERKKIGEELVALAKAYEAKTSLKGKRYGVIGTPSDWLIASKADYQKAKRLFGVEMVEIPLEEFYQEMGNKQILDEKAYHDFSKLTDRQDELKEAFHIHAALSRLADKYELSGFTMRCFDLLDKLKNTPCLAYGFFNSEGRIAACEGDVPSMISMAILNAVSGEPIFMANPSRIDITAQKGVYAHCTCPYKMFKSFKLLTHYESGLGFGVRGEFALDDFTMFKISPKLDSFVCKLGKIERNLAEENLCRSQIEVKFEQPIDDLLEDPKGNHMLFAYGRHKKAIEYFFTLIPALA
ncbi:MAG: hypothetical protein Q4F15_04315 [Bacillota bacterium]|nr:hypothetical protein [Bacillota bacterium]